jgi:hypothetical protein
MKRLPTLNARDMKGHSTRAANNNGRALPNAVGVSGRIRLSPRFVEWMMGLPQGWTEIGPSESTPSEMPSSRKQPRRRGASCGGG